MRYAMVTIILLAGLLCGQAVEWSTGEVLEDALKETLERGYHGIWSVDLSPDAGDSRLFGLDNYSQIVLTVNSTNFVPGTLEELINTSANEFAFAYHSMPELAEIKVMRIEIHDTQKNILVADARVDTAWIDELEFAPQMFTATKESTLAFDLKVVASSHIYYQPYAVG